MATQPNTLAPAMAKAFAEIEAASKDAKNPHFKSGYATLGAVVDAVKPALIKHGLFFTQETHDANGGVCIETVIRHASGEEIRCGRLFVPANKNDAQGFGSALTYARRYSLMTAFGVPAEDDDGNAAAAGQRRKDTGEVVDDGQYATLVTLAENVGADIPRLLKYLNAGVEKLSDLRAADYDRAVAALQAKRKAA